MEEEIWKPINGYRWYFVSNLGRIKKVFRSRDGMSKIIKPHIRGDYLSVHLYEDGIMKAYSIHRLVAEAFLENPENKPEVDHINRKEPHTNCVSNLRWATRSENKINRDVPINPCGLRHIRPTKYGTWQVTITRNRKAVLCKSFNTKEEAITARDDFLNTQ